MGKIPRRGRLGFAWFGKIQSFFALRTAFRCTRPLRESPLEGNMPR